MVENALNAEDLEVVAKTRHKSFPTLDAAYSWAYGLIRDGLQVQKSRLRQDFVPRYHARDWYFKILGVGKKTAEVVRKIEPAGEWRVEVEKPGDLWYSAGLFGDKEHTLQYHRFSAWYSRLLPYMVAMLKAEDGFKATGIDFESINAYYGTCYGFHYLGSGSDDDEGDAPGIYHRIDLADSDLYLDCYNAACQASPPQLPFDEVHRASMVYVACFKPEIIWKMLPDPEHWWYEHIRRSFEIMNKPQPVFGPRRETNG